MKNIPLLVGTLVGTLILIFGLAVVFSDSSQQSTAIPEGLDITAGTKNTKGNSQAKVQLVEFSDFECPACKANLIFVNEVMTQYPDDVYLVYRHFPLYQIHPYAQVAAQFAELAAEEGKFWQAHDLLFDRQQDWSTLGSEQDVLTRFEEYLTELEIDKTQFSSRIVSNDIKERVNSDLALSQQLKLSATPTFFVNGQETPAQDLLEKVKSILVETE